MKKKNVFAVLVLMSAIAISTTASAAPNGGKLHGEYSWIGTRTCVQQVNHWELPRLQVTSSSGASTRTTNYTGKLILNGDGKGVLSDKALQINHNLVGPNSYPIVGWTEQCNVTYQGREDGTIELNFLIPCEITYTSGSAVGANPQGTLTINPLIVTVSENGDTLLLSHVEPTEEETFTCVSGLPCEPPFYFYNYRICSRSFTAIRLSPQP